MKREGPKRGRRPTKRPDLTDLREALRDRRVWTGLGVVVAADDGGEHWELIPDDDGNGVDITIEVELVPDQVPLTCRLGFPGSSTAAIWTIPNIGDEVALVLPAGALDFMPCVVAVLPNTVGNAGGQGPAPNRVVIVGAEVFVHDGSGGAVSLVTVDEHNSHVHPGNGSPPTTLATGTTVLKAK